MLFNTNVEIAALITILMHLSLLAMLRAIGDCKPIDQLVSIINIPVSMTFVKYFAEELIKAYLR